MATQENELVKIYFDGIREEYAGVYGGNSTSVRAYIFSSRKNYVLDMLDASDACVLDIGCGPAVFTEDLLSRGCEVWGIDTSEEMIKLAKRRMQEKGFKENFHFSIGDIEKLNFPNASFDYVLCIGVLEYLKDDTIALNEILRVLKNNGRVIITVPNISSPLALLDIIILLVIRFSLKIFIHILGLFGIKIKIPDGKLSLRNDIIDKYYLPWRLNKELIDSGFKIDKTVFHAYRQAFLNSISPRLALFFIKKLEYLAKTPLRWLGINYIVKASKNTQK